jgi:hypothetical protein
MPNRQTKIKMGSVKMSHGRREDTEREELWEETDREAWLSDNPFEVESS